MPWSVNHHTTLSFIGVLIISSTSAAFLDNLNVANLNNLYNSYLLTYTENDFKSLNFSSSILGKKAILGNAIVIAGAVALLSLLPDEAFCFIKGTCPPKGYPKSYGRPYDRYRAHWKNSHKRQYYDEPAYDYYSYEEPDILKKTGLEAKRSKRELEEDTARLEYEDYPTNEEYLPAEHRHIDYPQERRANPVMAALSEIIFGNPLRRMTKTWSNVYQHYEDFWRFRMNNPGANYRHHLARIAHQNRQRNFQAQSQNHL